MIFFASDQTTKSL